MNEILKNVTNITADSRKVTEGSLFICLRGLTVDGHKFAQAAADAGAVALLVENDFDDTVLTREISVFRVENTRREMALLAAEFYGFPAKKLRLIGVTGTNGKTTTTYFIEEILRTCGRKTGLIGTVGLRCCGKKMDIPFATDTTSDPLDLHFIFTKMLEQGVTDVVMEVSSHSLALFKMEGLVFDVGVFTNLTQDHLDLHGTMENYAAAKSQLFAQSKTAVVNADDSYTPVMLAAHTGDTVLTYGIEKTADFHALHTVCGAAGSAFELETGGKFSLPVSGKFNVYNSLAAVGTAHALGLEIEPIKAAVAHLKGVPGRIQAVPNERGLNVFVDYAHSPDGLENIIKAVRETTTGRVITIFGCGGDRDKTKRPIMGKIGGDLSDYCILTSDNPRTEDPFDILKMVEDGIKQTSASYEIIENRRTAIFAGVKLLTPQDALIIAGKGHEDYQIIGTVKHHFDDFETATEALA
jgi:UDP-N-acetylmuramoyl-L-alanyl-D-glutamate--2,6-diaminopimelate ligase